MADGAAVTLPGASTGFPPVSSDDARLLILGSLPGQRSLREQQYYAHPQNVFWRIMRELVGAEGSYKQRCEALAGYGIALWDVLASSERRGSMDSDIHAKSSEVNDFKRFFLAHPRIERIGFNGQKAGQLFVRLVQRDVMTTAPEQIILPSTSPAYASMRFAAKLDRWRAFLTDD